MEVDYPSPLPSTRIPKHLHDSTPTQPRGSLGIVAALCRCTLSQTPTPHGRFVENKGLSAIRPSGDRAVEVLFLRNFELALRVWSLPCAAPGFQRSLCRLHPEALPDRSRFL